MICHNKVCWISFAQKCAKIKVWHRCHPVKIAIIAFVPIEVNKWHTYHLKLSLFCLISRFQLINWFVARAGTFFSMVTPPSQGRLWQFLMT